MTGKRLAAVALVAVMVIITACGGTEAGNGSSVPTTEPVAPALEETGIRIPATEITGFAGSDQMLVGLNTMASQSGLGDSTIAAYRFSDGTVAWEQVVPDVVHEFLGVVAIIDDTMIVRHRLDDDCLDREGHCPYEAASAYRLSDGVLLWQRGGRPVALDPTQEVLVLRNTGSDSVSVRDDDFVSAVAVRSGETVWSVPTSGHLWWFDDSVDPLAPNPAYGSPPVASHVVVSVVDRDRHTCLDEGPDGVREVRNVASGDVVWSGDFDGCTDLKPVAVASGVLLATNRFDTYEAHDLSSGRELWSAELPRFDQVVICGELICGFAREAFWEQWRMLAFDPQTGDEHWRGVPDSERVRLVATPSGHRLVAVTSESHTDGQPGFDRSWCATVGPGGVPAEPCDSLSWDWIRPAVLTSGTGEVVLDIGDWHLPDLDDRWHGDGQRLLLFRSTSGYWDLAGTVEVAIADLADLTLHVLGTIPEVSLFEVVDPNPGSHGVMHTWLRGCRLVNDEMLGCWKTDGSLEVWRFRA